MNTYMISFQLPTELTDEFISLIPKQKMQINKLMEDGTMLHYSVAKDRSYLWATIRASSKKEVIEIISTFPLIAFMRHEISELAIYNSVSTELPALIMN